MKVTRAVILGTVLAISLRVMAADLPDPAIGTWKLNVAKSTGTSLPKSELRTFVAAGDEVVLTFKRVGSDGRESTVQTRYRLDGKDYPISGSRDYDALSARRVAAHTVQSTQTLAGKPVGTSTRTVSADGKTMTLVGKRTNSKGETTTTTLVYERQ